MKLNSINLIQIRFNSYTLISINAVILIKSVSNDNNKYYSRVFLEKGFI